MDSRIVILGTENDVISCPYDDCSGRIEKLKLAWSQKKPGKQKCSCCGRLFHFAPRDPEKIPALQNAGEIVRMIPNPNHRVSRRRDHPTSHPEFIPAVLATTERRFRAYVRKIVPKDFSAEGTRAW